MSSTLNQKTPALECRLDDGLDSCAKPITTTPSITARYMPVILATQQTSRLVRRVRAADLRRATSRYREICVEDTGAVVLLDLEFLIAPTARAARTAVAGLPLEGDTYSPTVRYIGTPSGLAGLIADVRAARVADGVALIALDEAKSTKLLASDTVPMLFRDRLVDVETADELRAASVSYSRDDHVS